MTVMMAMMKSVGQIERFRGMKIEPFEASIRIHNQLAMIDLRGEINALAEAELMTIYQTTDKDDIQAILLNFTDVSYINSTGIAVIIGLLKEARKKHQRLMACGLSNHYQEIFQITRLAEFIEIFADETSALASVTIETNSQ